MADAVYAHLERMLAELQDLQKFDIFTKEEMKAIVKKRTNFEYNLQRPAANKEDFLRYIGYEMNLNLLAKKRKKRLGIVRLPQQIEYHFSRRIVNLFDRMLHKFGRDVTLWVQYIEYLKKTRNAVINRTFAQAIQLHPTNEGLWVLAASHEFEVNENITAARALMERAIRVNPKSERLWVEFCKLEFIYLSRIKERMVEYGIDKLALEPKGNSVDATSLPDSKAQPPSSAQAAGDPAAEKPESSTTTSNPFLEGAIPRLIFRNAINAIPDSLDMRLSLLQLFDSFENTDDIKQELFQGMLDDFGKKDPRSVSVYAEHKLRGASSDERPEATLFALRTFEEALKVVPTAALWNEYLQFCIECLSQASRGKKKEETQAWAKRVLELCQRIEDADLESEVVYNTWVDTLLGLGRVDTAIAKAVTATERYPDSASMWLLRIKLSVRQGAIRSSDVLSSSVKQLFASAFDSVPPAESLGLWGSYLDLVLTSDIPLDTKLQHFRKALVSLSQAPKCSSGVSVIKEAFITRVAATNDIHSTRKAYEVGLDVPSVSESYVQLCIQIERAQRPMDLSILRSLYRRGVRQHGKLSANLWLGWIELEIEMGDFKSASNLFWEAQKMLRKNNTKLIAGYQQLRK